MSQATAQKTDRTELGIAPLELADADLQRLKLLMASAIAAGSLHARWRLADPDRAHLVIGSPDAAGMIIADSDSRTDAEQVVAVLAGEADAVLPGATKLPWPIRFEHLIDLLKSVERRALRYGGSLSTTDAEHPLFQLAAVLQQAEKPADLAWRITGLTRAPIYVAPARRQYFCSESLRTLRRAEDTINLEFHPVSLKELPTLVEQPKPIAMLQWRVGLLTGPLGLLPWLDAEATFRLRRFPEFQILHHEPSHRRLAAAFSRPAAGASAVAEWTQLEPAAVAAFLNGAELCGYLSAEAATPASQARLPDVARQTLVEIFRGALGIETGNA